MMAIGIPEPWLWHVEQACPVGFSTVAADRLHFIAFHSPTSEGGLSVESICFGFESFSYLHVSQPVRTRLILRLAKWTRHSLILMIGSE